MGTPWGSLAQTPTLAPCSGSGVHRPARSSGSRPVDCPWLFPFRAVLFLSFMGFLKKARMGCGPLRKVWGLSDWDRLCVGRQHVTLGAQVLPGVHGSVQAL